MSKERRWSIYEIIAGVLLILAAVRNLIAPGLFSISRHQLSVPDIILEIVAGLLMIAFAYRRWRSDSRI